MDVPEGYDELINETTKMLRRSLNDLVHGFGDMLVTNRADVDTTLYELSLILVNSKMSRRQLSALLAFSVRRHYLRRSSLVRPSVN